MSVELLTITEVLSWNLQAAKETAAKVLSAAQSIDQEATAAEGKIGRSQDYFDSAAGDAARVRGRKDRDETFGTADVLEEMGTMIRALSDDIEANIRTIREKMEEVEDSRWNLFVQEDGEVLSHDSNWETSNKYFPFGGPAVAAKELAITLLSSAIQGALRNIQRDDQEGAEKFVRLIEKLPDAVKQGVALVPADPELAKILTDYQTDVSKGAPQLWPLGLELEIMRQFKPDFNPSLMTSEEIDAMKKLFFSGPTGPAAVFEHAELTQDAKDTAEQVFPASVDDGKGDAFRHAYWNALMTQKYGEDWTKEFATAHEKSGGNTPQREAMDLYNNELGRKVALAHPDASPEEMKELIRNEINNGNAIVIENKELDGTTTKPAQITWSNAVSEAQTGPPPGVGVPLPGKK
ncbi:wnt family protein [Nocardia asteroides]|nr:wnt family protein [Nocardia asteroides]